MSTIATFSAAQNFFNEGPDSPYNPISEATYNYSVLPEGCSDRDYPGEHRTPARGNFGMNALDGSMIFCRPKTVGALEEVIQDATDKNSFYVVGVHLGVRPYRNKTDFIPYNRRTGSSADYFSLSALGVSNYTNNVSHLYVAKIDINANVIWEGLYGFVEYSASPLAAYEASSYGYDIIKSSNGKLAVLGFAQINGQAGSPGYPVIFEIDPASGNLLKKNALPISGYGIAPVNYSVSASPAGGIGHSLDEIGTTGNYAVAVTYYFSNSSQTDKNQAYVWGLDQNFSPLTSWNKNPVRIAGVGPGSYNSTIWEIRYHKGLRQLLLPVISDCYNCGSAGKTSGEGLIYRMNEDGTFSADGINPSSMGPVNAFDLRIGVDETSDGGFVAVSSVRPPNADHSEPTTAELGYLASCPELNFTDWDTDALIVKYNSTGAKTWSKTFDTEDGRSRQSPPNDLKRQECVYKITQVQDGGYVISGNSSANFDDFYMAKLYNECNSQQTYTSGPGYVIDITEDVTWNSSGNVLGRIVVHPPAVFTISGPSTKICFADSKLTGIETNLTVLEGAHLKLINGAMLSHIDHSVCPNSNWDGVKVIENQSLKSESALLIYPNPSSDHFNLEYHSSEEGQTTYILTDLFGKEVLNGSLNKGAAVELESAKISPGVYFLSLFRNNSAIEKHRIVLLK